jgi:pentatricopeptide repeat protein
MEDIEKQISEYAARLAGLTGVQDKRVKKRVLQAIGKLKRKLSGIREAAVGEDECSEDGDGPAAKRSRPPSATPLDATSSSSISGLPEMSRKHMKAKLKLLNDELAKLSRKKMPAAALKRLNAAFRKGIIADVHSYTNVLHAYIRCDDIPGAENVLSVMTAAGVAPNIVTYTTLAKGYCERHEVGAAEQLLQRAGADMNIRAANTLLRGCLRTGDIDTAFRIYKNIGTTWNVTKDDSTVEYTVALLCQGLRVTDAENVAADLLSTEANPQQSNATSYVVKDTNVSENCAVYLSLCRASTILCDWKAAGQYLDCASKLHAVARTAPLRQSMLNHAKGKGEDAASRSTDLFLRHRHDEFGRELELFEQFISSSRSTQRRDVPDADRLLKNLNCVLRVLHFQRGMYVFPNG